MISSPPIMRLIALGLTAVAIADGFAAQLGERFVAGEILVSEVVGRLSLSSAGSDETPILAGTALRQGATLKTGNGSRATFAFSDGTIVKERDDSEWSVDEFAVDPSALRPRSEPQVAGRSDVSRPTDELSVSRTKLRFNRGEIEVQVLPLDFSRGARFQVETPAGIVSIRGTTFQLRLRPVGDDSTEFSVTVFEGMVVFFTKDGKAVEYVSPNRPYVVKIPRLP
ncbi:MAG: hypothetical protein EXS37_03830 [Opitutus sp.]|nr:hypothetical protein [Opitutus sp.]